MVAPLVVLIGPPGSGKSTIGRRLSRALNVPLTDTDHMIEEREMGTCGEIFTRLGEPQFRKVEEEVVADALTHEGVVSLGGGAVLSAATRELLADHPVVYLEVSAEEGARRTANDPNRPVLEADDPVARYRELLQYRAPLYQQTASFKVRSDATSPQRVVSEILGYLDAVEEDQ